LEQNQVSNKLKFIGQPAPTIWTVGHSTRALEDFIELLRANQIAKLADVRSYPRSRRYPQFNKAELERFLPARGFGYRHLVKLGGRRKPLPVSRNTAWRNSAFRAYADHMESAEFKEGIAELLELAREGRTAIMCAEAVWWRCHRGLIADYLKANGSEVIHILAATRTESHPYTEAARLVEGRLSYAGLFPE
jgi:uncharacterized protein (DUF488 family)